MKDRMRRLWHGLGGKKRAAWPRMEEGQYRTYRAIHPFDEQHGVETSGLLYDLPSGHTHDIYNNGYFAVAPSVFHGVMHTLTDSLRLDVRDFTFIDLGSGKGRALLLASEYPFREIIGVELSPQLDNIARNNIARFANSTRRGFQRPTITAIHGDAADFKWPPGPLIVYMWNAFTEPVLETVLHNLAQSLAAAPRDLYLLYMHPELEWKFEQLTWLVRVWREEFLMSEEDFEAWAFPTRAELCALYQAVSATVCVTQQAQDTKV